MNTQTSATPVANARRLLSRGPAPAAPSARTAVGVAIAALAASAYVNHRLARKAERDNPPAGRFAHVNGVRVHYVERGEGEPLVLLHGNGSMIQDFETSGLIDLAAQKHRVIAIDPAPLLWTPE